MHLIEGGVEHEHASAGVDDLGEALDDAGDAAPNGDVGAEVGAAVMAFEPVAEAPLGADFVVINCDVDAFGNGEEGGVFTVGLQGLLDDGYVLPELGGGSGAGAHPAIAVAGGALEGVRVAAAEPNGRVGFLDGAWHHLFALQLPEAAVVVGAGAGPEGLHDFQGLDEVSDSVLGGSVKEVVLVGAPTEGKADGKASAADVVQGADLLGHEDGISSGNYDDGGAQADGVGDAGQRS